ncbi:DUF4132 domain-containing protein [Klebsiella sp. MISC125]|uniref:DUF4132 domain-containing protein n=1 Tax=Klebsiella sp. MISC125 TaxID=2755386 RepID=UPI003DAA2084
MKTFIYQDEKSHKFWTVEQQDNELHLSWGKVGTSGQSQIKTFDDATAANKAELKLINEKTKKGYVEDCVAEASTPVPAQQPGSAPLAEVAPHETAASAGSPPWLKDDEPIILDPGYETNAFSHRRFTDEPLDPVNEDYTLCGMLKAQELWTPCYLTCLQHFDASACRPEWQQALEEAMLRIQQQRPEGSLLSDAILTLARFIITRPIRLDIWLDSLVQQRGLEYATDLVIALQQVQMTDQTNSDPVTNDAIEDSYEQLLMDLKNGKQAQVSSQPVITLSHNITDLRFEHGFSDIDFHLRKHLSLADESTWQRCADKLIAALPSIAPRRRPLIAFLLPEKPEIANQLALELVPDNDFPELEWLNIVATDPHAVALLEKCRHLELIANWGSIGRRSCVETLLREKGISALPRLKSWISAYRVKSALEDVNHPQAMALLMTSNENRDIRHLEYFTEKHPESALYALTQALSNEKSALYLRLLKHVVLGNPLALKNTLPWLAAEQQQLLFSYFPQLVATKEFATANELPSVLVSPPWLNKKQTIVLPVLALFPLSLTPLADNAPRKSQENSHFTAEEILQKLGVQQGYAGGAKDAWDAAIQALKCGDYETMLKKGSYNYLNLAALTHLPADQAMAIWNIAAPLYHRNAATMVEWFGLPTLPGLLRFMDTSPKEALPLMMGFGATEFALPITHAFAQLKSVHLLARSWLLKFPEHAITGLLPTVFGKAGREQNDARLALRLLIDNGYRTLVEQIALRYGQPKVTAAVTALLDRDPLDNLPIKIPPIPAWYQPATWRRPVLKSNGKALADEAIQHLCTMLAFPREEMLYPGIVQVLEACTPQSLADFAWDLFQSWEIVSGSAKDNWAFLALGIFGNDDTVRRLTPLIRAWPGESQHKRATVGLDILAAIGSDIALMQLNGIALKLKFKALQQSAREKIAKIAESRELTVAELEDRLAPDLDLDDNGTLTLDFGPRRFSVSFDEALKPFVRDENGSRLKDLPKPNKSDDETRATEAVNRYKLLKKDARTVAAQQIMRLESAMCLRRRWTQEQFRLFLVEHPLVRHITRRLVWGVYSEENTLLTCFRVAEDNSYSDAEDNPFNLPEGQIGIPHVLEISPQDIAAFGQLFADYELLPPFRQLDRNCYALREAEQASTDLQRWAGREALSGRVAGLVHKGWQRGEARDAGGVYTFYKPVDDGYVELEVMPGFTVGLSVDQVSKTQELTHIQLCKHGSRKTVYPFSSIDMITASELINDIESLFD